MWKLLLFQRLGSRLFHLITVKGKHEYLKKLGFISNKGTLSTYLVLKAKFRCGTVSLDDLTNYFYKSCKKT